MSLLMDALKKAEREKKEAAKRSDETGPNPLLSNTSELPIDPVSTETDLPDYQEDTSSYDAITDTATLSLEPIDSLDSLSDDELPNTGQFPTVSDDTASEQEQTDDEPVFENTQELSRTSSQPVAENFDNVTFEDESEDVVGFENTQSMEQQAGIEDDSNRLDADASLESSTEVSFSLEDQGDSEEDNLEDTRQQDLQPEVAETSLNTDEMQYGSPLEIIDNQQFVKMLGEGGRKPTPAAADTVFKAGHNDTWVKSGKGIGALVITVLLSLGLGGFLYYWLTPSVHQLPSPIVAKGVEKPLNAGFISSVDNSAPSTSTDTASTAIDSSENVEAEIETQYVDHASYSPELSTVAVEEKYGPLVDEDASNGMTQQDTDSMLEDSDIVDTASSSMPVASADKPPRVANSADSKTMIQESVDPQTNKDVQPTTAFQKKTQDRLDSQTEVDEPTLTAPVTNEMIQITRAKPDSSYNNMNQKAFKAYQDGHYDVAYSLYKKTLKDAPDNRDALLGMAAIDVINNRLPDAYQKYRRILVSTPDDVDARLAIVNLRGLQKDNESLLKILLQGQPDSAELHFSLGSLYARQQRWAEAQQMFFEAYRRASGEPDYALNLAVSLDQMGQSGTARDYYKTALQLADTTGANFDLHAVKMRIDALTTIP